VSFSNVKKATPEIKIKKINNTPKNNNKTNNNKNPTTRLAFYEHQYHDDAAAEAANVGNTNQVKWFISETPLGVHERASVKEHLV